MRRMQTQAGRFFQSKNGGRLAAVCPLRALYAEGLAIADIEKKWSLGLIESKNLRVGHKEPLAAYLVNQVKAAPGTRIYTASHNMIHPIIVTETVNSMYTAEFYYPHLLKVPIETPVCGCIGWRAVDEKMLI